MSSINSNFPVFTLVGCLFDEKSYKEICEELNNLKLEFFSSKHAILHSRDIRKCEEVFVKLFDLKIKERFYNELNRILLDGKFSIISVSIKKSEFIEKYGKIADDLYELSLSFILERAVKALGSSFEDTIEIVIESRGKKENGILQKRYNKLLDTGSKYILPEEFKLKLQRLEFRRKNENDCGLQIADLCAYPVSRHIINPLEPYPAFDIVCKKFRRNRDGKYKGYGLKIFP